MKLTPIVKRIFSRTAVAVEPAIEVEHVEVEKVEEESTTLDDVLGILEGLRKKKPIIYTTAKVIEPEPRPNAMQVIKPRNAVVARPPVTPPTSLIKSPACPFVRAPGHIVVEALAGTGKTFTIVEGIKRAMGHPDKTVVGTEQQEAIWTEMSRGMRPKTVTLAAFNVIIAAELKSRIPKILNVNATTIHKLGFQTIFKNGIKADFQKNKTRDQLAELLEVEIGDLYTPSYRKIMDAVIQLVKQCKCSLVKLDDFSEEEQYDELMRLAMHFEVEMRDGQEGEIFGYVVELMRMAKETPELVDFDDMLWLPIELGLEIHKVELLVVDERQDLNLAQQELVMRSGERIIMVGDRHQAIYAFAGADSSACDRMNERLTKQPKGCKFFPLTRTRRCCKVVTWLVQSLVPEFEHMPDAPDGRLEYGEEETFIDESIQDGDMVVCRLNAPCIKHAMKLLRKKRKVRIQGRKFGEELIELINSFECSSITECISKLGEWYSKQRAKVVASHGSDDLLIALEDKYYALVAFTEGNDTLQEMLDTIDALFSDKAREGTLFSSIHGAKGLEADRVHFLQYDKTPHHLAKQEWQIEQEWNLWYVACTRAKTYLNMVTAAPKPVRIMR